MDSFSIAVVDRDQALDVQDNVDGVHSNFRLLEKSLSDIRDKVWNSTALMGDLRNRLQQVGREPQERMPRLRLRHGAEFLWCSSSGQQPAEPR